MGHNDEISNIRKMINKVCSYDLIKNYATSFSDEELRDGVTYLSAKETGLSKDIIVDNGENYKIFNHPLCVYIVEGDSVFPITVDSNPVSPYGFDAPKDITIFIEHNRELLKNFADLNIDAPEFFNNIRSFAKNIQIEPCLVSEMSQYGPNDTGLPMYVYIDDTGSYQNSGHNGSYRMKFQQDKSIKNPRLWMPITIPGLEVMEKGSIPPCKEPQRNVNLVITWAKYNLSLLVKLRDGEISGMDFEKQMKTMEEIKVMMASNGD